jgi:dihydrofolate reductase
VAELKQAPGRELQVHGSWQLVQSLHQAGLVDRYRILVFPIVVGRGKRLSADGTRPTGVKVATQKFVGSVTALELEPIEFTTGEVGVTEEGKEVV